MPCEELWIHLSNNFFKYRGTKGWFSNQQTFGLRNAWRPSSLLLCCGYKKICLIVIRCWHTRNIFTIYVFDAHSSFKICQKSYIIIIYANLSSAPIFFLECAPIIGDGDVLPEARPDVQWYFKFDRKHWKKIIITKDVRMIL